MIFHGLITIKLCAVDLLGPTLVSRRMHGAGSFPLRYLIRFKTLPCKILSDPPPIGPFTASSCFYSAWNTS